MFNASPCLRATACSFAVLPCLLFAPLAVAQTLPDAPAILSTMNLANDYWIANHPDPGDAGWARSAYFTGNMSAVRVLGDIDYLDYAVRWGEQNLWDIGPEGPAFADAQCCGQTYIDLYRIDPQPVRVAAIQADLDIQLNRPKVDDWSWIDAFFMSAPVFARLGTRTGNAAYYDKLWAMYQYMKVTRNLFDSSEGLWFRDQTYIYPNRVTENGQKVFWARGNGWVIAGLARVLQELPANSPYRAAFVTMLQTMADSLRQIQGTDGFWRASLFDPAQFPDPETSGTAFFTYAMAWAVNEGLLDENVYRPVVAKAWNGLVNDALHPDGRVGWVQPPNVEPAETNYQVTTDYGVGAFLLAGSELAKLQGALERAAIPDAGPDQVVVDADGDNYATVTLDAGGTIELQGNTATYEWRLGSFLLGTGPLLQALLPVGSNEVTLKIIGASGSEQSDTVTISVQTIFEFDVDASDFENPNVPANVLDGDLNTRWSAEGDGQWIALDLGESFPLHEIGIAFYKGNIRTADFEVQTSSDELQWTTRLNAQSSGTTLNVQSFSFPEISARHIRFVGYGNSENDWNSITEVEIHIVPTRRLPDGATLITENGAWTWFNGPRAVFHNGNLIAGSVRSDGKVAVTLFDPAAGTTADSVLGTPASAEADDHNNPSLTVLPDGRIVALYSKHGAEPQYYHRTSLNAAPEGISDWGPEVAEATPGAATTYNNTFCLSGEADKLFNFQRTMGFNPNLSTSLDHGATWQYQSELIRSGNSGVRPYVRYVSNDVDRIDFVYTDGHPNSNFNSVFHAYYHGGAVHNSDASFSKPVASLPYLHDAGERGTTIYQYNGNPWGPADGPDDWIPHGRAWVWDIRYGADGNPVCVFSVQRDQTTGFGWSNDRIYYYYARWDGSAWHRKFIANAGRPLYRAERDYAGGITIDPDDPRIVYLSTNALDPFDLSNVNTVALSPTQRYEIWRGITHDHGDSFVWTPVTQQSTTDNLRPYVPAGHGYHRHLIWLHGRYTAFTDFDVSVLGLFDKLPLSYGDWAVFNDLPLNSPEVDTEGDGLPDGFEYVLDLDPHLVDSDGAITLDPAGFQFTVPVPRPDATVKIEGSTDEAIWHVIAVSLPGEVFSVWDLDFTVNQSGGSPNAVEVELPPRTRVYLRLAMELDDALSVAYMNWASIHGLAPDALGMDTDGDGLADGFEYLFDLDPNARDALDAITVDATGFRFTVPLARPDTIVHVQRSRNQKKWETIATSVAGGPFSVLDPLLTVNQSGGLPNAVEVVLPPVGSDPWSLRLVVELEGF